MIPLRRVVVLDYGSGNLRSAERALRRVGARVTVSGEWRRALAADGLVVPGVGAFAACMRGLRAVRGPEVVADRVEFGLPVLGICVGMQVLFEKGNEHGEVTDGVGLWPGTVGRLEADILPHMGWNTVRPAAGSRLLDGLDDERFYFVHSYAATDVPGALVSTATHGATQFAAVVEDGPLCATQFHPEKSGDAGAALLENWLQTLS